jgi:GNAT superfamily N-acetyltransferase
MSFEIRQMRPADLDTALGWARDEGWNPGLDDARAFFAADPSGFFMGFADGVPVACISVVKYGDGFASLGLYIVRPSHRGKGLGKAIWDAATASAGTRTVALDGVPAQQDNYRTSGFALAHRSARWGGRPQGPVATSPHVRALSSADWPAVLAYDAQCFPAPRDAFLAPWLQPSAARQTAGWFEDGQLRGYGAIRRSVEGWKVGPLFADDAAVAEALIGALIGAVDADQVFIDVPEPNVAGVALARRLGLTPAFETARMYRGPDPRLPLEHIFGITTLELG